MTRVGRPDCLVVLRLYEYGRPARAIFGKQGGGKYSVFLVELRALALAVLAVQVCCRERGDLQFLQRSRIDRFVAEACNAAANSLPYEQKPRRELQLAACKDTSKQTRNAHAAV